MTGWTAETNMPSAALTITCSPEDDDREKTPEDDWEDEDEAN